MTLGIYGSGGLGREIMDLVREINVFENIVYINDFKEVSSINNTSVFTFDEFKTKFSNNNAKIVIAVGAPKERRALREKAITNGYKLQTLVHPSALIGSETEISDGVIIRYGSNVSCNVKIGSNVLIQQISTVAHDCVIDDDTVISSMVSIAGNCRIGGQTFIGNNVAVREKTTVGANTIIGMGAVVLRNIPENTVAYGNPAHVARDNGNGKIFK